VASSDVDRWGNDRRKVRWVMRQLYVLGMCVFTMALSVTLIASVEPELNERLGQTAVGFGLAFSMLTVGRVIFQIPIGNLSDRVGRRRLILTGLVLLAPLTLFQGIAPTTFWLSVDRFLLGAATSLIIAPAYAMVADRRLKGLRVRQMSIMTMSFGLGIATGPLLSGTLAGTLGFQSPFLIGAVLSGIAAFCFYLLVEESNPAEARMQSGRYP
jgi:MFS family permease